MEQNNEIILYQPDDCVRIEVRLGNDTVWLTQQQIAMLFGVKQPAISKHMKNIYESGELLPSNTYSILEYMGNDGTQTYKVKCYNLDMILSIGYRVNSINATRFRQWANQVLKDYLLKGVALNQRLKQIEEKIGEHAKIIDEHSTKIDFFVRTSLPPVEGIFYDGEMPEPFGFVNGLIRSAKRRIVLIDNYVDETVLLRLAERRRGVSAQILTRQASPSFAQALELHNRQYEPVALRLFTRSHDRFLIIDDGVYHIGASIKDLGKKWFAFCKMEVGADEVLERVEPM